MATTKTTKQTRTFPVTMLPETRGAMNPPVTVMTASTPVMAATKLGGHMSCSARCPPLLQVPDAPTAMQMKATARAELQLTKHIAIRAKAALYIPKDYAVLSYISTYMYKHT